MNMTTLIGKIFRGRGSEAQHREIEPWCAEDAVEYLLSKDGYASCEGASRPREFYQGMAKIKARIRQRARFRRRLQLTIITICLGALVVVIPSVHTRVRPVHEQHSLIFTNVTVAQLLAVLGDEHGVRIDVSDPTLLGCSFTGTVYSTDPVLDLLRSLADTLGLTIEVLATDRYRLSGKGCIG